MSTRLVERLEADIAHAEDPFERECLKAQHAAVIARLGLLEQARFTLAGLRTQSRRYGRPRLQAWVHFLEGSIHYFTAAYTSEAPTSFRAAQDLAQACGDTQLQALALAWLAAAMMRNCRDAPMMAVLTEAMRLASADHHAAQARAWLVLANVADYANQFEASMHFYERVRLHAVADGDSTTVSLMLYNRANSLVSHHVRCELFGAPAATALTRGLSEIESAANLDLGLGGTALHSFTQIVRAEALTLVGRWADAVALLNRHLDAYAAITGAGFTARFQAHRSWCHAKQGHTSLALSEAKAAQESLAQNEDPDDLAVTHQRLANTFVLLGLPERAPPHATAAVQALQALSVEQSRVGGLLDQFKISLETTGIPWPPG